MSDKINLSLDAIIAKEGIGLDQTKSFAQRIVKKDGLNKFVVSVDNNSNNKRKVDIEDPSDETTLPKKRSNFPNTCGQIFVDNLKYEVSDDDIQQLFGAFGTLKRAAVNYRNDGRSEGTAFVVFEKKSDAEEAIKSYNNITLDGRPLRLNLIDSNKSSFARNSFDFKSRVKGVAKEQSGSGRNVWTDMARNYDSTPTEERNFGNFKRFNKSDDNKAKEKEMINAEDLDADLESYLSQRKKE